MIYCIHGTSFNKLQLTRSHLYVCLALCKPMHARGFSVFANTGQKDRFKHCNMFASILLYLLYANKMIVAMCKDVLLAMQLQN